MIRMRENSGRRVEGMGGKHGTGRQTGTLLSTVIEIACMDPLYMWIYTRYSLDPSSSG